MQTTESPTTGDPSDVDNLYTWTTTDITPDGTAFTGFLGALNNCYLAAAGPPTVVGGLGGHCDWRLPTIDELNGIIDLNARGCPGSCINPLTCPGPCIDQTFGPTKNLYWSSTTEGGLPRAALIGVFASGSSTIGTVDAFKSESHYVRAVRGGL